MGEWKAFKKSAGTGLKELEREAGTGWKALLWESNLPVDVGAACIDRGASMPANYTILEKSNPSNANSIVTNVCAYIATHTSGGCVVGTFYQTDGNTYKCRDAESIPDIAVGVNNKTVNLTINTGDLIGFFAPGSAIDREMSGGLGIYYVSGNHCIIDDISTYSSIDDHILSLYGTG